VNLGKKGELELQLRPLTPLHDMRQIRGTFAEVTEKSFYEGTDADDYLQIILTDEEDVPEAIGKLRIIYPNLMKLSYDNTRTRANREIDGDITADRAQDSLTPESVFAELFELQNNAPASERIMEIAASLFRESKEG
jgi:exonuclease SbcD